MLAHIEISIIELVFYITEIGDGLFFGVFYS